MYLISPRKHQYKANLHSHSIHSDGELTPAEMKAVYKEKGYSVLAVTDHETPGDHTTLSEPDFLLLTGYEAYIRPDPNCNYNAYAPEVHLNLFAKDPHNTAIVCYNPQCCKYSTREQEAQWKKVGAQRPREYTVEYINEFIRTANENGYLVSYNHPVWSMESEERILSYEGIFSLEMVNGGSYVDNRIEYNGPLYDKLLLHGRKMFVHAADDNHNHHGFDTPACDSFVAATMILAEELTYGSVIAAMEQGEMYATMGPVFKSVSFDGATLHVECSAVDSIVCHMGSKNPAHALAGAGETLTCADLPVHPQARYVRITLKDTQGRYADTRAFTREELGLSPLE